jgi:hypothetical protein
LFFRANPLYSPVGVAADRNGLRVKQLKIAVVMCRV